MAKIILKKVPEEDVWYNFEDEVYFSEDEKRIVICGNDHFQSFGDSTLISIVKGNYYDDDVDPETGEEIGYDYEVLEELEKVTGKKWEEYGFRGYSQGDWQDAYYIPEEVSQERMKELDAFFMGKVDEFRVYEGEDDDCPYCQFIPHDVTWEGKKAICDYIGYNPEDVTILEDKGYTKVYNYVEMTD